MEIRMQLMNNLNYFFNGPESKEDNTPNRGILNRWEILLFVQEYTRIIN
jgi:hypothetical protein